MRLNRFLAQAVLAASAILALTPLAHAQTAAGDTVSNQASVNYQVGGVAQTAVLSDDDGNAGNGVNPTNFLVDRKLDATVTELSGDYNSASTPTVVPGQNQGATNGAVLGFTVTNTGNQVQDFSLGAAATTFDPFSGTDTFDATNVNVFVDANGDGIYQPGTDTATFIDELSFQGNAGGDPSSVVVFVVSDIPLTQSAGDIAAYVLNAQVAEGGTPAAQGADITTDDSGSADSAGVDDVFADGENTNNAADGTRDGIASAEDAYQISAPVLTVAKSSQVISDPFNGTANPKAIPGAVIEYTITVSNAVGGATATNVNLTDDLSGEIVGGGGTEALAFLSNVYGGTGDIELTVTSGGVPTVTPLTEEADADSGSFNANIVSVTGITLAGGDSAQVSFRVEIQ
ncbi:MAG: hypothetical protein AB8G17_12075 [Gammaproteobacteria bacterium]